MSSWKGSPMRTSILTLCLVATLIVPIWAAEDFTGTKQVRLSHGDIGSPKAKTVVITDKAKIEKLVATIKLEEKVPCACDHIDHAVFVKEKGEITVSLCDHCFDIGKATYRMPPEFYKLYTSYWQEASAAQPAKPKKARAAFILGADISWVQQQEEEGTQFSDQGVQKDIFAILKDHKFNWIRLRIFNNPKAEKGYSRRGYCDLEHTLHMAKRIKAAGMGFLLDFHYSDTWADPRHQVKPSAWKDLHGNELEKAVQDYTKDVVAVLKRQGTSPDMVQIGNEISNGFLWPDAQVWKSGDWDAFCGLIKAGIAGAKLAEPSVKIMLHLACGGQNAQSRAFMDKVVAKGVEFDILGQSYYPRWHGTLDELKANLTDLAARYQQDIILVEYAAPHLKEINDIVHRLPNGKGLGTFYWEPTKGGPGGAGMFERNGNTKPEIDVYPELVRKYENSR